MRRPTSPRRLPRSGAVSGSQDSYVVLLAVIISGDSAASQAGSHFAPHTPGAGRQLLVWGGVTGDGTPPPHGEVYTPATNAWTALPASPLRGRADPVAVWTGRQMIVWGGYSNTTPRTAFTDGAVYTAAG
jgi:hypothetical protein